VNDEPGAAFAAVHRAFQIMIVDALTLTVNMTLEYFLNLVPSRFIDDRRVFSLVLRSVIGDYAFIITSHDNVQQIKKQAGSRLQATNAA
jgi:hypothetical protein